MTSAPTNQFAMRDPRTQYPVPPFPEQTQEAPGLASRLVPRPDHGEASYVGFGRLAGRKALITGADSGIGRAVAIAFAREGADLALTYLPEEQPDADEVIELAQAAEVSVHAMPGDLTSEAFCTHLVDEAVASMDGLDLLVNVAGAQHSVTNLQDLTTEQFDHTFRTNVYAMFWLCKAALPHMPAGASIINTASIQSYDPSDHLVDYASTKAAIVAFTKALAAQVAGDGIRVNAVAPGPFWTVLQPSGGQQPERVPTFGEQSAFGRPGQPAEIAPTYVLLGSQEGSFITGETIGVTGGQPTP